MAKTYLGDWGTYYFRTNTSSPDANYVDCQVRFYLTYEQQPSSNQTTVYVQPYIKNNNPTNYAQFWGTNFDITSTINGSSKTQSFGGSNSISANSTSTVWGTTQSFVIKHDDDGTASCKLQGKAYWSPNGYTRTCSNTWTLPTINRTSSVSNNTSSSSKIDFGSPVTFTISRPNSSITHTLTYVENGTTYTIGTGLGESATYTFPTSYINNYKNTAEVSYVVTCTSSNGLTSTTTVYLKVPDSYKPSVALAVSDGNSITKGWGIWVQNKSILNYSLTPTLSASSPIKTYYTSINNTVYYDQSKTISPLTLSGTVTIKSYVTDNRNRTSDTQTKTLTVYAYSNPTFIKCEVIRCNANGVEDNDGTYGKIKCSYSISPCNNKNAKSLKVTYGSTTKNVTLSAYSAENLTTGDTYDFNGLTTTANHTFTFTLTDSFGSFPQTYTMPPSFTLVSKRAGGKGITFGQIATQDGFHSYLDSVFHKALTIPTGTLLGTENLKTKIDGKQNTGYYVQAPREFSGTLTELYENVKGYNGVMGSVSLIASNGIPQGWYNFFFAPHRQGGISSDNYMYGTFILCPMTFSGNSYIVRITVGQIAEVRAINTSTPKTLQWVTVTTSKTWSINTVLTYENVLEGAVAIWIGGKVYTSNTGMSSMMIPMNLISTTENNFLINDELYWVRTGMYRSGNNLLVVDRGRAKDGWVSNIYVLKYA